MLKKISVERLRAGMYVHELCADWMSHPFWRSQFLLKTREDVQRVRDAGVRELYIDTAKGLDDVEARSANEVRVEVEREMLAAVTAEPEPIVRASLEDELGHARLVHAQAHQVVRGMMQDVPGEFVPRCR